MYQYSGDEDILLFDFSANKGDTIHYEEFGDFIVDTIYSVTDAYGIEKKRFEAKNNAGYYSEGLGGAMGPFGPFYFFESGLRVGCISYFNYAGCSAFLSNIEPNGKINNEIRLFPIPVENVLNIQTEKVISQIVLYTMQGAVLFQSNETGLTACDFSFLPSGIYLLQLDIMDRSIRSILIKR